MSLACQNFNAGRHADLAIIGGGAAGLFAAIFAGQHSPTGTRIVVLDGAKKLGTKILIAGGGRCNVTHDVVRAEDYASGPSVGKNLSRNAINKVLRSFTVEDTIDFFRGRGVELKREDTGKLFPTTDKARSVLDALLGAAREAGVELRTDCRVRGVGRWDGDSGGSVVPTDHSLEACATVGDACPTVTSQAASSSGTGFQPVIGPEGRICPLFKLATSQGELHARRVILCTGGRALPASGSDGFGYELAKSLGHTVPRTWPALVPMTYAPGPHSAPGGDWLRDLKGIAVDVILSVQLGTNKILHQQAGPLLFTHFGVSGPAAMDISRHLTAARRAPAPAPGSGSSETSVSLVANLVPSHTAESLEKELLALTRSQPRRTVLHVAEQYLPARLAASLVIHAAGLQPDTPLSQLPKEGRRALVQSLTALPLPVAGDRGYDHAEVTAGGVPLAEVETMTMRSRVCDGLYLAGELLDVDGRIGGYNFQWAWCTGRLAGVAAARSLGKG